MLRSRIEALTHRRLPRWWVVTAVVLLAAYLVLTVLIVLGSPLDRLDLYLYDLRIAPKTTAMNASVSWWVEIGQGVPCSTIAALYAIRRSTVTRNWTPWVMFCIALITLNVGVGAMKHLTGRLGPLFTNQVHTVWAGGTIYPSGHAANAVVMYGLIAMLVPAAHRRVMTKVALFLALSIGLGTVLLNTHWVSDVFGGWIAGVLVLQLTWLLAPRVTAVVERTAARVRPVIGRWWAVLEFHQSPAARAESDRRWGDVGTEAPPALPAVSSPAAVVIPAMRSGARREATGPVGDPKSTPSTVGASGGGASDVDRAGVLPSTGEPGRRAHKTAKSQKTITIPSLRAPRRRRSAPPVDAIH